MGYGAGSADIKTKITHRRYSVPERGLTSYKNPRRRGGFFNAAITISILLNYTLRVVPVFKDSEYSVTLRTPTPVTSDSARA